MTGWCWKCRHGAKLALLPSSSPHELSYDILNVVFNILNVTNL